MTLANIEINQELLSIIAPEVRQPLIDLYAARSALDKASDSFSRLNAGDLADSATKGAQANRNQTQIAINQARRDGNEMRVAALTEASEQLEGILVAANNVQIQAWSEITSSEVMTNAEAGGVRHDGDELPINEKMRSRITSLRSRLNGLILGDIETVRKAKPNEPITQTDLAKAIKARLDKEAKKRRREEAQAEYEAELAERKREREERERERLQNIRPEQNEHSEEESDSNEEPEPEPVVLDKISAAFGGENSIITSSIRDLMERNIIEAESVDWIITDPPYPREYLNTWKDLVEFASHALKPGGHLIALSGQSYLPEVMRNLEHEDLTYVWTLAYMMKDHIGLRQRPIAGCGWKPLLWYCKGGIPKNPNISDVIYSDPAGSGEYHKWGQSSDGFVQIFDRLRLKPDDLVVDPFLGGGTTAIACLEYSITDADCVKHGRLRFIGADIDEACITTTEDRTLEYLEEHPLDIG